MVKINLTTTDIPIEFGNLTFYFKSDDESKTKINNKFNEMKKEADALHDKMKDKSYEKVMAEMKSFLGKTYDSLLGEGAFDKIYEQTPSTEMLIGFFFEMLEGIDEELSKRNNTTKLNKYLNK